MDNGRRIRAEHGVIYSRGNDTLFGYFGWPSVCRISEHGLLATASGFRTGHIDPFGKDVCFTSEDDGRTWSAPLIVNNSPVDDRDTGLTSLGNGRALMTWFSSDIRVSYADKSKVGRVTRRYRMDFTPVLSMWDDETVEKNVGFFTRIREASGEWGPRRYAPVSAPHGAIKLKNGSLLYLGNVGKRAAEESAGAFDKGEVAAAVSDDEGASWRLVGKVPCRRSDTEGQNYDWDGKFCEPHVVELPNGELLGAIRYEPDFSIFLTRSADGGATWSKPEFLTLGAPPSLVLHSSGTLVLSYGWRREKDFGQRIRFSADGGKSWSEEWILRDDGPDLDLGYPSSVELADGSICTVYYQKAEPGALNCSLLTSHWRLPEL